MYQKYIFFPLIMTFGFYISNYYLIIIFLFSIILLYIMPLDEKLINYIGGTESHARFDYQCGHCNRYVSGRVVNIYGNNKDNPIIRFMICPSCLKGSVWMRDNKIIPGSKPGQNLEGLPVEVEAAYQEARKCFSISAFTACELLCRKIIMHVGVNKGAQEGQTFVSYLDHLENKGYITPTIRDWTDLIRQFGNQSTHKLASPDEKRTETTLMFTMELLRIIYEMEHIAAKFKGE